MPDQHLQSSTFSLSLLCSFHFKAEFKVKAGYLLQLLHGSDIYSKGEETRESRVLESESARCFLADLFYLCYVMESKKIDPVGDLFCCRVYVCQMISFWICHEPTEKSLHSVHIDFLSNQRGGSLDPAMTNGDLTDEEIFFFPQCGCNTDVSSHRQRFDSW